MNRFLLMSLLVAVSLSSASAGSQSAKLTEDSGKKVRPRPVVPFDFGQFPNRKRSVEEARAFSKAFCPVYIAAVEKEYTEAHDLPLILSPLSRFCAVLANRVDQRGDLSRIPTDEVDFYERVVESLDLFEKMGGMRQTEFLRDLAKQVQAQSVSLENVNQKLLGLEAQSLHSKIVPSGIFGLMGFNSARRDLVVDFVLIFNLILSAFVLGRLLELL